MEDIGASATTLEPTVISREHSFLVNLLIRLVKEKPLGMVGGIITLLLLLTGIFADFIAPYGMNETHRGQFLSPPSKTHLLGTDNLGRDILSRVIYGARISVIIGLAASAGATLLSLIIGILSGYIGGKFDLVMQRVVDAWMCFPGLILLIVLMSVIGMGMIQIIIVLSLRWGFSGSRIIRGAVMSLKENVYIQASVAIGCSTSRILIRHILPNLMAPTIILFTTRVPDIIMTEAALSFLGFGIPPPTPTWGGMLSGSARQYMLRAPWLVIWPGVALSTVVYGINMFGDALRDLLDPKLRGGSGRYGISGKRVLKKLNLSEAPAKI
jgi:peptide/nickel transport system permease protein